MESTPLPKREPIFPPEPAPAAQTAAVKPLGGVSYLALMAAMLGIGFVMSLIPCPGVNILIYGWLGARLSVQCTNGLHATFAFDRADPNTYQETFPGPATAVYADRPLENTTSLTTVTYSKKLTRSFFWWVAKCFVTWAYKAMQSAWYDGGMWV